MPETPRLDLVEGQATWHDKQWHFRIVPKKRDNPEPDEPTTYALAEIRVEGNKFKDIEIPWPLRLEDALKLAIEAAERKLSA